MGKSGRVVGTSACGLLATIACFLVMLCCASPALSVDLKYGDNVLRGKMHAGQEVVAHVEVDSLSPASPLVNKVWGSSGMAPAENRVGALRVQVGGGELIIRLSAYADLGEPYSAGFEPSVRGVVLVLLGGAGDGYSEYRARFYIEPDVLRRRRIESIYPRQVWEETVYTRPFLMDD